MFGVSYKDVVEAEPERKDLSLPSAPVDVEPFE
jgi:hypothetical protein